MRYLINNGQISGVEQLISPNFNTRPEDVSINAIIIHCISLPPEKSNSKNIKQFFCNKLDFTAHPYFQSIAELKVSAHLLIEKSGHIVQFVPFHQRAWHAGVSSLNGEENCNDFSIGIELEGRDDEPFERIQYEQLAACVQTLMKTYPDITRERIVGHSDVAPGRKTDPGPRFDWVLFDKLLKNNK